MSTGRTNYLLAGVIGVLVAACSTVLGVDFDAPHLGSSVAGDVEGGVRSLDGCVPKSCAEQGLACGTQGDGCGGAVECGSCNGGQKCSNGKCTCTPKTCPELGASCGVIDDGCGAALDCGACTTAGQACAQQKCECQPKNCAARGANCGTVPDGCGNSYDCGTCATNAAGPNCGGDGPNKCGMKPCIPQTCAGKCGDVSDGCGTVLRCPGCTVPQICGGSGTPNVCGCTMTTCAKEGKNCGAVSDGCGGTLDCGVCASPNSCGGGGAANVCGCTPTATACPAGQNCGSVPNGCGTNLACGGPCLSPQTCGGGGVTNVCGCTPLTCADFVCGSHSNGCGGTLYCGTCTTCFAGGTQITMDDGAKKSIESVVAGDWVRTANPATGTLGRQQVVERKVHPAALSRAGLVVIDGALRATRNHPILVNGKSATMEDIRVGDVVMVADRAGAAVAKRVANIALEPGGIVTYDLVLKDAHGHYFADGVMIQQKAIP